MKLIKTNQKGRPDINKKHDGNYYMSIRNTRGTFSNATVDFLGLSDGDKVKFFEDKGKVYISVVQDENDKDSVKKITVIKQRYGVYTKSLVSNGSLKTGGYYIKKDPIESEGILLYELVKIKG